MIANPFHHYFVDGSNVVDIAIYIFLALSKRRSVQKSINIWHLCSMNFLGVGILVTPLVSFWLFSFCPMLVYVYDIIWWFCWWCLINWMRESIKKEMICWLCSNLYCNYAFWRKEYWGWLFTHSFYYYYFMKNALINEKLICGCLLWNLLNMQN